MDTALYYTFSTVAQALAAAMALLAAFALYRLQSISAQCTGVAVALRDANIPLGPEITSLARLQDWPSFLDLLKPKIATNTTNPEILVDMVKLLPKLIRRDADIRRALWISLALTANMMAASVWVLAKVPAIAISGWTGATLACGVMGFVACLISYLWLLYVAFQAGSRPPPPKYETSNKEPTPHCEAKPFENSSGRKRFWDFRASHWVTALLTAALVWVGAQQVGIYGRQADIMSVQSSIAQNQLSEMQAEQRAWLSTTGVPILSEPIGNDANGIRIALEFLVKNTGKNPAFSAFVSAEPSISQLPNAAWQESVCKKPTHGLGASVFPGDQVTITEPLYITADDYSAYVNANPRAATFISPSIMACVVYQDAVTGKWHHTPFSVRMWKGQGAMFLKDFPIKASDIAVKLWPINEIAPD